MPRGGVATCCFIEYKYSLSCICTCMMSVQSHDYVACYSSWFTVWSHHLSMNSVGFACEQAAHAHARPTTIWVQMTPGSICYSKWYSYIHAIPTYRIYWLYALVLWWAIAHAKIQTCRLWRAQSHIMHQYTTMAYNSDEIHWKWCLNSKPLPSVTIPVLSGLR